MSRCSPFPPLGYVWKGVCGEALVELTIKVKKEWTAAEKKRKKERRRQRKKEKREKRKIKKEQSSDKWHWGGWNTIDWEREYEPQMLQNFSLTEELEQHIVSGGLVRLFYNSEDTNKRKPCSFPCGCHKPHGDGNIIWTEFLPQKHTDPEVQSTSNRMEKFEMDATPAKVHIFPASGLPKAVAQRMDPRPGWMLCHSAYERAINEEASETVPITRIAENDSIEIESQLRELLDNWVPDPQLSEHTEFDDQEWLFETRSVQRDTTERSKPIHEDIDHGSSTLYPHARYLPEADLIALPFTIIF